MRVLLKKRELLLRQRFINQPVLAVQSGHRIFGFPLRRKTAVVMLEQPLNRIVVNRLEILDFALPAYDQRQRRRLDPSNRQNQLVMPGPARSKRIGPRQIHTDKPVRPRPCQC